MRMGMLLRSLASNPTSTCVPVIKRPNAVECFGVTNSSGV
jgi:hypothetical protein